MLKRTRVTPNIHISVQCKFHEIEALIISYKMPTTWQVFNQIKETHFYKSTYFLFLDVRCLKFITIYLVIFA